MSIREITTNEKNKWNSFVQKNDGSFLQSWEWGELQEKQFHKIWRFIIGDWEAVFMMVKKDMRLGQSALYVPRGPVGNDKFQITNNKFQSLLNTINKIAKQEKVLSIEIDPADDSVNWSELFDENGYEKNKVDMQPRHTLILDLSKTEEDLLENMHQKHRYNIRLAEKKGVKIIQDNKKVKDFYNLLQKTNTRQKIEMFPEKYYQNLLALPFAKLYLAEKDGKVIAANIILFWNDTATYLFGASDYEYRKIMAPHLLQWQSILDAKNSGLTNYDFWGAAPENAEGREKTWGGFTRFKKGFAPEMEITEYPGTFEKKFQPVKLGLYRFIRRIYS